MKKYFLYLSIAVCLGLASCSSSRNAASGKENGKIDIVFVQVNDVYEIAPLEGGKTGGMARVATLKQEWLAKNPNTFMVMAGDFLSPSVYNSLKYDGKRIRGRQMVEAMNVSGMDIAIFGNHEFDINENELQERLNESQFRWISSNSFHKKGNEISPFMKVNAMGTQPLPETYIMTVKDADGTTAKVGFFGLVLPFNKASFVSYTDPFTVAETLYNRLKDSCDAVIAITHQAMEDDVLLAEKLPGLAAIIGGHEHDRRFQKVGNVYITKAHANARSAYIVKLRINQRKHTSKIKTELKMIDQSIAMEPATDSVVNKWMDIGNKNYASLGFDAKKIVLQNNEPLDGREESIRTKPTNFTAMIMAGIMEAAPSADVAILNAGAIRVDDILPMPVTQYDIIRSLPFGGGIAEVDMKGSLLIQTLEAGKKNIGIGGFLHYNKDLVYDPSGNVWSLKNTPLDPSKTYHVALLDFLMTGGEANMDFLTSKNPGLVKLYPPQTSVSDPRSDIRLAIVRYMEKIK
ncbi:MAG: bifunctional metallophosphatase/5'-nucleotidase [Bacteroidota bacterium]